MPVYRKPHEKNFTVIDNGYMLDRGLSLKAKGLLTLMLVLPGDWKFSREGLEAICIEGKKGIQSAINELKKQGYLQIIKQKTDSAPDAPFAFIYEICEDPFSRWSPFGTSTNGTSTNGTSANGTSLNGAAYKIRNNQELNNKILNDKEHSHQIQDGAGGCSDEEDYSDGEDGTEEEGMDDIPVSENGKRIATRSLTTRNDAGQERETKETWRPKASATDKSASQCSGGVYASTVPVGMWSE